MHLYDSQVLVIRMSVRKALGIKGKGNNPARCFLKVPLEGRLSRGPRSPPRLALAPPGCGKLCRVELLRFLLFVQGP